MRVAGFGFRGAATVASLQDALAMVGGAQAIATETQKSQSPVFRDFAEAVALPCIAVSKETLAQIMTPTQSARVQAQFGVGSLAEAAAMAAAGAGATLVAPRVVSSDNMATAAIAQTKGILS